RRIHRSGRRTRREAAQHHESHRPTRRFAPASGAARADEGGDADMSAYREFTGKTVEEALKNARDAFGAGLDDLDFEILTPGSRGVLGMGAEPARIVAAPRAALGGAAPKREAAAAQPLPPPGRDDRPRRPAQAPLTASEAAEVEAARGSLAAERADLEAAEASPEALDAGRQILEELMRHLGFDIKVEVESGDTSRLNVVGVGGEK